MTTDATKKRGLKIHGYRHCTVNHSGR